MSEADRIRWQCRRGLLELDLVLSRFLDRHLQRLSAREVAAFQRLLQYPDNDLWALATGKQAAPDPETASIIKLFD